LPRNYQYTQQSHVDLEYMRNKLDALVAIEGIKGGWDGLEFVLEREPNKPAESGSKRIANLINKDMCFIKLINRPDLLAAIYHLMQDEFKLSAAGMREPLQGQGLQKIHVDWMPRDSTSDNFECLTCYFAVDDLTIDNGTISLIPGTHKKNSYPNENLDTKKKHPDEFSQELKAGDWLILNSLTWHRGNINRNGQRRRALFLEFRNRKLSQGLKQQLYLSEDVKTRLNDLEKWLLMVGIDFPTDTVRHLGAGEAYRRKYPDEVSAHEI